MPLVLGIFQLMLQYHHFASQLDNWMSFANAISKTYLVSHQITVGCILLNHFLGEIFLSPFCKPVDYKTINSGDLLPSHRLQNRKLNKREKNKDSSFFDKPVPNPGTRDAYDAHAGPAE